VEVADPPNANDGADARDGAGQEKVHGESALPPDPNAVELLPASLRARFDDIHFLGRGGMGAVYAAHDVRLDRNVALKFVDVQHAQRILREARAQARIEHENVCKIYNVGVADGRPYICMQLIYGEPLSSARDKMTLEQKVKVVREAAAGLHEAHRNGLVHRDVKPGNILVEPTEDGQWKPYVADFGLAREAGSEGETATGIVAGTPEYMAPEQARGEVRALDRRTDVYSLGVTLYDLVADRTPFIAEQRWQVAAQIAEKEAPPLRSICPTAPRDLETIIMKCLEREPARRYDSARALGEDLQRFLDGDLPLAQPRSTLYILLRRARKHKLIVALSSLVTISLVTLLGLWIRARQIAAEEAQLSQNLGEAVKEMELFLQYAHALPLHDVVREEDVIRERLTQIEGASSTVGRGTRQYAIGRGYLALREPKKAVLYLEQARSEGYSSPELEFALGRALVELYQEGLEELGRLGSPEKRAARHAELETLYKAPALLHLQSAGRSRLEYPLYVEGLIALLEGKHQEALEKAQQTLRDAPWFYEAKVLEARAHFAEGSRYRHDAAFDYEKMMTHFGPAIEAYKRAADMGRSDPSVHDGACELWIQLLSSDGASGRATKRSFEEANGACGRAIATNPNRGAAYVRMAFVHVGYADAENEKATAPHEVIREAVKAAEVAASKLPEDVFAQWLLGAAWRQAAYHAVSSGLDGREAADRSIAAYTEALRIDPSFLWAARELAITYVLRAEQSSILGEDATMSLENARMWLRHADAIAQNDPLNKTIECHLESVSARTLLDAGSDPTPSLGRAGQVCKGAIAAAPDFIVAHHSHGLALVTSSRHAAAFGRDAAAIMEDAEQVVAKMPPNTPAHMRAQILGPIRTLAARQLLVRGESPELRLREARELLRRTIEGDPAKVSPRLDLVDVELARIDWAMTQGLAEESQFTDVLEIVSPLLDTVHVDPRPFQRAAKIHGRHAAWLASRDEDFTEALTRGVMMTNHALRRNPRMAAAFATRAALYLVRARTTKVSAERIEAAMRAKEAFAMAFRDNPSLAREYAELAKEADFLADDADVRKR
jgi:eukaryotic-like serine/threonine-protein kinase